MQYMEMQVMNCDTFELNNFREEELYLQSIFLHSNSSLPSPVVIQVHFTSVRIVWIASRQGFGDTRKTEKKLLGGVELAEKTHRGCNQMSPLGWSGCGLGTPAIWVG